ncbi:ABC transporter permease [Hyalangium rubrum]|uniref:ABC transporter permease subunit n=1 Tax=Hyalangium rubrum TaxID=3103134 RepID=A0ABU5HBC0_9BACT|nr:ABC transporter permease subunit [Hyalangium sp. s54d21]MDY7230768.1 ABC transporter permease subunit [Hyalangium sp. s54d21]
MRRTLNVLKEIAVIWGAETRRSVRSGRAVVLLGLYTLFAAFVLVVVGAFFSQVTQGNPDLQGLTDMPPIVLVVFKVNLFFLPAYVALMGFDQISGEVGTRSIRYLTLRARLSALLIGKFLVQATLLLGLVLIIDLGIFVYAKITTPGFTFSSLLLNLLKVWGATTVFSLAYVALTTFCSSVERSSAVSLVFNFILLFIFWLMDFAGGFATSAVRYIRYLSPSFYSSNLLSSDPSEFGVSGLAYAVFTLVFLGGAYAILRARDL